MAIKQNSSFFDSTKTDLTCYHCGSMCDGKDLLPGEIAGELKTFCCVGCLSIAQMIHGQGLEVFYTRRDAKDFSSNRPNLEGQANEDQFLVYDHPAMLEKYAPTLKDGTGHRKVTLRIENIQCAACVWLNEQHWRRLPGIRDVQVNYITQRAVIVFDSNLSNLSDLLIASQQIGYRAWPFELSKSAELAKKEERQILFRLGVAMLGMMQVMMYAWPTYVDPIEIDEAYLRLMGWAGWLLTLPVIFFSAAPMFQNAYKSIQYFSKTRTLHMDVPISVAIGISWLFGTAHLIINVGATYFDSITMFVALLLLARFIELKARHQTQNAVEGLAMQLPTTCNLVKEVDLTRLGSKRVQIVPLQIIEIGNILQVFPGEVIPADGIVLEQAVTVSEAILTGESQPISKLPNEQVYAGSYNLESTLYLQVTALGSQTKIAAIAHLLETALSQKPQYASTSEKLASYFVMGLLFVAVVTGVVWYLLGNEHPWERALAVLVVTCPCALSLAIPLALAASQGLFAKNGLVVISPDGIDKLNHFDIVFLDKTGTVTLGEMQVVKVSNYQQQLSLAEIRGIAKTLEFEQNHPIANAICSDTSCSLTEYESMERFDLNQPKQYLTGCGVICGDWRIGSPTWIEAELSQPQLLRDELLNLSPGTTPICLMYRTNLVAIFELRDVLRPGVREFVDSLLQLGKVPYLISGDDLVSVRYFAEQLGIHQYFANCTPEEKLRQVEVFQQQGKKILAIGDGVNDAPFLGLASISIAMGQAAPLSQVGADLILFSANFDVLKNALIHAKNTQVIIQQNLIWGLLYNLLALPLAMMGYVGPLGAAVGMSISSILVSFNASRLGKWKLRSTH